ncbi:hypothetical protein MRB53_039323 [Persea americana]|nr:hypothetical protein MRB53_039323 [Persea americana]
MSKTSYELPLPTTGALFFSSFFRESSSTEASVLTKANNCRAQLRDVLKTLKRSEQRDLLGLLKTIQDYLPAIFDIRRWTHRSDAACRARARIQYEVLFVLFTYASASTNYAIMQETAGNYQQATEMLCKAAGIFEYLSASLLPEIVKSPEKTCPEIFPELAAALSKYTLAEHSLLHYYN